MWYRNSMKKIVTHDGKFHADDIFGVAVLQVVFGAEELNIVRTREQSEIDGADIVLDVGGEYDPARYRFDHHQNGAPVRENGIPYAAFGLVWKEYGEQVAGTKEIAEKIDNRFVQPIDAGDNGVALYTTNHFEVSPLELHAFLESFMPPLGSDRNEDEAFFKAVDIAREYLLRVIENYQAKEILKAEATRAYEASEDKQVLVFDSPMKRGIFSDFEGVLAIVTPVGSDGFKWSAQVVPLEGESFATKSLFPVEWAGLKDGELETVSGINGALFCHKGRFLFMSKTKEGAIAAAKQAK